MRIYAPPGELIKVSDIGDALVYLKYESPTFVDEMPDSTCTSKYKLMA